jgi:hypothetical protein
VKARIIDATAGRRYFTDWIAQTFAALDEAAKGRVEA